MGPELHPDTTRIVDMGEQGGTVDFLASGWPGGARARGQRDPARLSHVLRDEQSARTSERHADFVSHRHGEVARHAGFDGRSVETDYDAD
jgi:hypothetical protein